MRVQDTAEIEPAISGFAGAPHGGLLLTGAAAPADNDAIKQLALHYRLPLMYGGAARIEEGVLMSHGPDGLDLVRRAASYVDCSWLRSPFCFQGLSAMFV
jgi:putative ABC transport system substrate-binding protein